MPAWPLLQVLATFRIRRVLRRQYLLTTLGLATYAAGLALLAALPLAILVPLATVAALVVAAEIWRSRDAYGQRRKLPPGSLARFRPGPWQDIEHFRRLAERHGPIFKTSLHLQPTVCVVGQERVQRLLTEHAHRLVPIPAGFERVIPAGFLRMMRPQEHARYRPLFRVAMGEDVLRRQEPLVRHRIAASLARLAQAGPDGSHPEAVLRALMLELLVALFYGVRPGDPDHAEVLALQCRLNIRKPPLRPWSRELAVLTRLETLLRARGRSGPAPDCVLDALAGTAPQALDDPSVIRNLIYAVAGGRGDLAGLAVWILKRLGDEPAWLERVAREPAGGTPLAERIVMETLRLHRSEYLVRRAAAHISFEGFRIPKGWRIRLCIREGHRRPDAFSDPLRFDPDRFPLPEPMAALYRPLGIGAHACLGAPVIRYVGRLLVEELAWGYTIRTMADGPSAFLSPHWQPDPGLRLRLTAAPPREVPPSGALTGQVAVPG